MEEQLILVDEMDQEVGSMEKLRAHREGKLHRAFSIVIFNTNGKILLQKRAANKYHSGALWSNACCSHPRPGEVTINSAKRRLKEETGLVCELQYVGNLIYKTVFKNGLTEYEYDHIFSGFSNEEPILHPKEAEAYRWEFPSVIKSELITETEKFTVWFNLIMEKFF